jgi:multimeric flavodoxin WrbA
MYMRALIVSDNDFKTAQYEKIRRTLGEYLSGRGFETEEVSVGRGEIAHCKGCFGCWTKTPGECVIRDRAAEINRASIQSDAVVYLSPVVFGQFSANIKDVIDRWLPNMLPFFIVRSDGSTMHPPRYDSYPAQAIVGYGEDVSDDDAMLFKDITEKHRNKVRALVLKPGMDIAQILGGLRLEKTEGVL